MVLSQWQWHTQSPAGARFHFFLFSFMFFHFLTDENLEIPIASVSLSYLSLVIDSKAGNARCVLELTHARQREVRLMPGDTGVQRKSDYHEKETKYLRQRRRKMRCALLSATVRVCMCACGGEWWWCSWWRWWWWLWWV
jgi:hypothetical protein